MQRVAAFANVFPPNPLQAAATRWKPGTLITIKTYRGETRDQEGEAFAVELGKEGPFVSVRLFACEGESPQFRRFFTRLLEAE